MPHLTQFAKEYRERDMSVFSQIALDWRKRAHARRVTSSMLKLYLIMSKEHSGIEKKELYLLVLTLHFNCSRDTAEELMRSAEESFAIWPVERKLRFRDLVHYVALIEWMASNKNNKWTHHSISEFVATRIPSNL